MKNLVEWAFRFSVDTQEPTTHHRIEELLSTGTQWAEAHSLGIGGGFRAPGEAEPCNAWDFDFGLCATLDDQPIPETRAQELLDLIRHWCSARDFILRGGFREYKPEELEPLE